MKSKKAQAGLPINYTIILVIAVLVIGLVFYAAIRFELLDKFRGLPVGDDEDIEVVDEIEVADACPEKIGYFAKPTKKGYNTNYKYLHYINGTVIPVYRDKKGIFVHEWQGFWSFFARDNQIGSLLDFGNDYVVFNCDAIKSLEGQGATQKDIDYFHGSFTIAGFVQEGKEIICQNKEIASKIACLKTS